MIEQIDIEKFKVYFGENNCMCQLNDSIAIQAIIAKLNEIIDELNRKR